LISGDFNAPDCFQVRNSLFRLTKLFLRIYPYQSWIADYGCMFLKGTLASMTILT